MFPSVAGLIPDSHGPPPHSIGLLPRPRADNCHGGQPTHWPWSPPAQAWCRGAPPGGASRNPSSCHGPGSHHYCRDTGDTQHLNLSSQQLILSVHRCRCKCVSVCRLLKIATSGASLHLLLVNRLFICCVPGDWRASS